MLLLRTAQRSKQIFEHSGLLLLAQIGFQKFTKRSLCYSESLNKLTNSGQSLPRKQIGWIPSLMCPSKQVLRTSVYFPKCVSDMKRGSKEVKTLDYNATYISWDCRLKNPSALWSTLAPTPDPAPSLQAHSGMTCSLCAQLVIIKNVKKSIFLAMK